MRKIFIVFCLLLFTTGFLAAQASVGGTMYVSVKTLQLKSSTGLFASGKGTLEYGARVIVLQISGSYMEVRSADNAAISGWAPAANLTTKQISAGNTATVSNQDTALASKGFDKEVEDEYKKQNRNLNFSDVDRVERIVVSDPDLKRFLEEGRLAMGVM